MLATEPVAVPAAPDNTPALQHFVCPDCYPDQPAFPMALCGERLLGVPAPKDVPVCMPCAHVASSYFTDGTPLRCGHTPS